MASTLLPGPRSGATEDAAYASAPPCDQPGTPEAAAGDLLARVRLCLGAAGFDLAGPGEGGLHLTGAGERVILAWRPREILLTPCAAGGRELSLGGIRGALHAAALNTLAAAGFIVEPGTGTQVVAVTGQNPCF